MVMIFKIITGLLQYTFLQVVRLLKYLTTKKEKEDAFLVGQYLPVKDELDIKDLKQTEEKVPKDITGIYIRNGPNQYFPSRGYSHLFDGDGMLHSMNISEGNISYTNKFVKTEKLMTEKKIGKALVFGMRHILDPYALFVQYIEKLYYNHNLPAVPLVSNTSVVFHANKLFSLNEGDLAYQLDENKLETVGKFNFDSKWTGPTMSAHPKVDPFTGEMILFGYDMMKSGINYGISDKKGDLVHQSFFNLDYATMIHDFAITDKYTIFMIHPLIINLERFFSGNCGFDLHKDKPSIYYIAPRYWKEKSEMIEFQTDGHFIFHTGNAYEEGDEIVMTACKYADELNVLKTMFALENSILEDVGTMVNLVTFRFNMKTKKVSQELHYPFHSLEFPVINQQYVGVKNRFTYLTCSNKPGLMKHDAENIENSKFFELEENYSCGEAIFAPRDNSKSEDDGYLMTFVYNNKLDSSTFDIIDAKEMKRVSSVKMPRRIPSGFHGTWIPK
eukprot:gene7388-11710_t